MEEIGKALKTIFDKLSDFFDIFDLSFFVSGVFTTGIIYFWAGVRHIALPSLPENAHTTVIFILFCYINGLISFALGRWIRMGLFVMPGRFWRKRKNKGYLFDENFKEMIIAHGLENKPIIKSYLETSGKRGIWRLYVRLWADIRNNEAYSESLSFLKRYWVMAATYDGLSTSILVGIILLCESEFGVISNPVIMSLKIFISVLVLMIISFLACIREGNRFVTYQMEEVIATIASNEGRSLPGI